MRTQDANLPGMAKWWWEYEAGDQTLARGLFTYFEDVKFRSSSRLLTDLENLRLYGAPQTSPYIGAGAYGRSVSYNPYGNATRVTVSLVQACIDTLTSKLSSDQPRPMFITQGGDFEARHLAEDLQAFADGVFDETKTYDVTLRAFVDAAIFGTGFIYVYKTEESRIGIERVFPYEIFVDDADGLYGEPRNIYRVRYIDRNRLMALYPDQADEIVLAQGLKQEDLQTNVRTNLVQVVEAWHLPSSKNSKDGRHMIAVSNTTLVDEEYEHDYFPLAVLRYNPKQIGFFGQGLAEPLASPQTEMNTLLRKIQICMHFLAVPHWLKPSGSGIQFGAFNNQIGSVINYTGVPPELKIWQSVPPECFRHVDWLWEKAFEIAGVSQLSAQSKIPGYGTMSGAALREYSDVESDRFQALSRAWQRFHIDLAQLYVNLAQDIVADGSGYPVTFVRKSATGRPERLEIKDWKDIAVKEREFQIQIQPVSKFATDIPGVLQTGQELVQAGLMDADTFKDLMSFPDLKAEEDLEGAARKLVHKMVYNILSMGKYQAPDPYMDLVYALKYATLKLNQAIADDLDDSITELLRTWISACDDLMQQAKAAQGGAPGGQPPGGPPAPGAGVPGPTPAPPPQPLAPTATPAPIQ